jgi:hypothetical protein
MGVKGYWTAVLGLFKYRRHERLSPDDYARVAIDVEILIRSAPPLIFVACRLPTEKDSSDGPISNSPRPLDDQMQPLGRPRHG